MEKKQNEDLGKWLRKFMTLKKITARKLSEDSGLNISTVYKMLNGKPDIRLDSVKKVAETLNVPLAVLLDLETVYKILRAQEMTLETAKRIGDMLGVPMAMLVE